MTRTCTTASRPDGPLSRFDRLLAHVFTSLAPGRLRSSSALSTPSWDGTDPLNGGLATTTPAAVRTGGGS